MSTNASIWDWDNTTSSQGEDKTTPFTMASNVTTAGLALKNHKEYVVGLEIRQYGVYVLVGLGILGNLMSLLVCAASSLRGTTSGIYMMSLATADTLILLTEIFFNLGQTSFGSDLLGESLFMCFTTFHFRYSGRMWSSFLTAVIAVERFIVVWFPLKSTTWLTKRRARMNVLWTFVVSFGLNAYVYYVFDITYAEELQKVTCDIKIGMWPTYEVWVIYITVGVGDLLSCLVMIIFSALITYGLLKSFKFKTNVASTSQSKTKSAEAQITAMLFSVILAFIACKLPYLILYFMTYFLYNKYKAMSWEQYVLYNSLTNYMYLLNVLNHCINFVLYCVLGSNFRNKFKEILCKCTYSEKQDNSNISTQSNVA